MARFRQDKYGNKVPFTPEEEAEADARSQQIQQERNEKEANEARLTEMKDDTRTLNIIDKLTNANNTQIDSFVDSANTAQLKTILAGVLKVMGYKLR